LTSTSWPDCRNGKGGIQCCSGGGRFLLLKARTWRRRCARSDVRKKKSASCRSGSTIEKYQAAVVEKNRSVMKVMFVGLEREKKVRFTQLKRMRSSLQNHKNLELHVIGDGPYCAPVKKLLSGAGVLDPMRFSRVYPLGKLLRGPRTHGHCHGAFRDHGKRRYRGGARRWW